VTEREGSGTAARITKGRVRHMILLGSGPPHWATQVHVADIWRVFPSRSGSRTRPGRYVIGDGPNQTPDGRSAGTETPASFAAGAPGAVPGTRCQATARRGGLFSPKSSYSTRETHRGKGSREIGWASSHTEDPPREFSEWASQGRSTDDGPAWLGRWVVPPGQKPGET